MYISKKEIIVFLTDKISQVLDKKFDVNTIGIDQPLVEIGIDSMDVISIIVTLEDFYDIEFIDENTYSEDLSSIENIATIIFNKLLKKE